MVVKLQLNITMKNGINQKIYIEEIDPKGYLIDKKSKERKEIALTDKEVQSEYARKFIENIEKKKPIYFKDSTGKIFILNPYEVSSIDIQIV